MVNKDLIKQKVIVMYESDIANAANVAGTLAACVRDVLETAQFTIDRDNETIVFHNETDSLLVEAVIELSVDGNENALKTLKSTIGRESSALECFGATVTTKVLKNGKEKTESDGKGFKLSFKSAKGFEWTVKAPTIAAEPEPENILVETAKNIANAEFTDSQLHQLAVLLAKASESL